MKTTKNWAALLAAMGLAAGLAFGGTAAASYILLTPTTEGVTKLDGIGGSNYQSDLFGETFTTKGSDPQTVPGAGYTTNEKAQDLTMLYKSDFGGSDSGDFASSYTTTFSPDSSPSDATIEWVLEPHIICPNCYLAIKDGAFGYYTFNLNDVSAVSAVDGNGDPIYTGAWDGKATIVMEGFWAGTQGAISHVAIWGDIVEANGGDANGGDANGGDANGGDANGGDANGGDNGVPEPASIALFGGGMLALGWAMRRRTRKGDLG